MTYRQKVKDLRKGKAKVMWLDLERETGRCHNCDTKVTRGDGLPGANVNVTPDKRKDKLYCRICGSQVGYVAFLNEEERR